MATAENIAGTESGNQVIGKVSILYGNVKAISSDGTERSLSPNSLIFAYDRVITESDGMVSITIDDGAQTQIDIGRMSDVVIDEDIFAGVSAEDAADAAAEVEQIQEALLAETFDPTVELEAAAAGESPATGGGHPVPDFARVTHEGNVTSGAETTGIGFDTVGTIPGVAEPPNPAVTVAINAEGGFVPEGDDAVFTVTVNDASENAQLTLGLSDGTALTASDYNLSTFQYNDGSGWQDITGPITLSAGTNTLLVRTDTVADNIDEPDENFSLSAEIVNENGASASASAEAIIVDGDIPSVQVSDDVRVEGDTEIFTVTVTNAADGAELSLNLTDGTAEAPADYNATTFEYSTDNGVTWQDVSSSITLGGGNHELLVRTDTVRDNVNESDENFFLNAALTNEGGDPVADSGEGIIVDGDMPAVLVSDDIKVEGDTEIFTVTVTNAADGAELSLNLTDGTAEAPADYNATTFEYSTDNGDTWQDISGPITLGGGNHEILVRTDTSVDDLLEGDENFFLNAELTNEGGDPVADTGEGIIVEGTPEPDPVTLSVSDDNIPEGDDGIFTVTIGNAPDGAQLNLGLSEGTAEDPADYHAVIFEYNTGSGWLPITGPIDIPAGDSSLQVRTDTVNDSVDESNESFFVNGSISDSEGTLVANTGTGTILDNDIPPQNILADDNESVFTPENTQVSGNVLDNTTNPDGPTIATVTQFTVFGDVTTYAPGDTATISGVGTLTIASNGVFTFTPESDYTGPVPITTYTVFDGEDTDPSTLSITVTDTDNPMNADDDTDSFTEDEVQTDNVAGATNVLTNDDESDTTDLPLFVADADPQTVYELDGSGNVTAVSAGTIDFAPDGTYTLTLDTAHKAAAEALDDGESFRVGVTYTAENQDGATDDAILRITVNGVDDAMNADDDTDSFTEDAVQTDNVAGATNVLTNDDESDTTDLPLFVADADPQTVYELDGSGNVTAVSAGTIDFAPDGTYTLTLDTAHKAAAEALDDGESFRVGVTYTAENQDGATDDAILRITVNGVDDAMNADDDTDSFTEDEVQTDNVAGATNVLTNDDESDTTDLPLFVADADPQTVYELDGSGNITAVSAGTIDFAPDGTYTLTLDTAHKAAAEALDDGESFRVGVTYTAENQDGATDDAILRITVNGGDDAMNADDDTDSFTEDAVQTDNVAGATNVLTNDDESDTTDLPLFVADADPQTVYELDGSGNITAVSAGTIDFAPDGTYTLTLDTAHKAAAEALDDGESFRVGVTYTAENQDGATDDAILRITVNGGDVPMNADDDTDSFTEDAVQTDNVAGATNVLTNDDESDTTDLPLFVADADPQTVYELDGSGNVTAVSAGTIDFAPDGTYTLTLDTAHKAAAEALDDGESFRVGVTYTAENQDGATDDAILRITVNGVDDAMNADDDTDSFTEDAVQTDNVAGATNVLTNDDESDTTDLPLFVADADPQTVYELDGSGNVTAVSAGTIDFAPDGTYTLTLDTAHKAAAEALDDGESFRVGVTYTAENQDGATDDAILRITVNGVDDAMNADDDTDSFTEEEVQTDNVAGATNVLTNDDESDTTDLPLFVADADPQTVYELDGSGNITAVSAGTIDFAPDGTYTLTLDTAHKAAAEALDDGESFRVGVTYTAENQDGATDDAILRITVNGGDVPMNADDDTDSFTEDAVQTDNVAGATNVLTNDDESDTTDLPLFVADADPQTVYELDGSGNVTAVSAGTIDFAPDGTYTLTLDTAHKAAAEALDDGESFRVGVTYTAENQDGATDDAILRITVNGVDDAMNADDDTDSFTEDAVQTDNVAGATNVLTNDDESDTTDLPLFVADADPQTVYELDGSGNVTAVSAGTIDFAPDGTYTLTLDTAHKAAAEALDDGESFRVGVTYTAENQDGATDDAILRITVNGGDDAMNADDDTDSFTEDAVQTDNVAGATNVLTNDDESDTTDLPLFVADADPQTVYELDGSGNITAVSAGTIDFAPDGTYTLTLDTAHKAAAEALDDGESFRVGVTYTAENQDGATDDAILRITVNGVDDAMNADDDTDSFTEDAVQTDNVAGATNVLTNDDESDTTDLPLFVADADPQTVYELDGSGNITAVSAGTIDFAPDGTYTLTLDTAHKAAAEALDDGESFRVGVTYTAENQDGATDDAILRITVNGGDDAMNADDDTDSFTEDEVQTDNVAGATNVLTNDDESDTTDLPLFVADADPQTVYELDGSGNITAVSAGTIDFAPDGTYTLTLDTAHKAAAEALDDGESFRVGVTYTAENQDGATDDAILRITVNGGDDAMNADDDTDSFTEDAVQTDNVAGATNVLTNDDESDTTDLPLFVADADPQTVYELDGSGNITAVSAGTIDFAPDGTYTLTLDTAHKAAAEALDDGESFRVGVTYTAENQDGATDDAILRITVNGVDDAMNADDDTDSFTEDEVQTDNVAGATNVLDNDDEVDTSDQPLVVKDTGDQDLFLLNTDGSLSDTKVGTINIQSDGEYTFTLDAAYKTEADELDTGETLKVGVEYTAENVPLETDDAILRITIIGDTDPTGGETSATVDDEGLSGGIAGGTGDIDANAGDDPADTSEASFTGTLDFEFGGDGPGSIDFAAMHNTTDTVGQETVAYDWNGTTNTLTATVTVGRVGTDLFNVVLNPTTGVYTVTLLDNVIHAQGPNDENDPDPVVNLTFNVYDSDDPITPAIGTLNITFDDDMPTIDAMNLAIPNIEATFKGNYSFDVGADAQAFDVSIDADSLTWTNAPTEGGFSLDYNAGLSSPASQVYVATYDDGSLTPATFFTVSLNEDGTYDFTLNEAKPVNQTEVNILQGIEGGSGLASYTFASSLFNGHFELVVTGYDNGGESTLTISSTDLGVAGNTVQEQSDEYLRFDMNPVDIDNVSIDELTVSLASTGGIKNGDILNLFITYTDGSTNNQNGVYQAANNGDITFQLNPDLTLDYFTLHSDWTDDDGSFNFKIDGISVQYTEATYPDDYGLQFTLEGTDADGDSASSDFSVFVNTADENGDYVIEGSTGSDVMYGTSGADTIHAADGGEDIVFAGGGDDEIFVNDGGAFADHVDGGDGFDTAHADSIDSLLNVEDPDIS